MSNQNIIKTENVLVRVMELATDASAEWHYHSEVTDFFVCLNGSIKVETRNPDAALIMLPGHRAEVKPHQVHRVVNISSNKSEYLLVQGVGTYDFIKV